MIKTLNIRAQRMRVRLICCALFFSLMGWGQVLWGPNALPVIDMSSGETTENLSIEISNSYYNGFDGSNTFTPNLRLNIPLFSRWVNLEAWYSVMDFYSTSYSSSNWNNVAGDIYVSTNIQVLHRNWFRSAYNKKMQYIPSAVARIGIKTASGGDFENHRFIDAPGYFLDLTLTEKFYWQDKWAKSLSIAGLIGFYCWQTGKAEQNDAYMYGLRAEFEAEQLKLRTEWSGYTGWQNNGDKPMTLKAQIGILCQYGLEPYIAYQYGIRNWQYHEIKIGLKYSIDIIK